MVHVNRNTSKSTSTRATSSKPCNEARGNSRSIKQLIKPMSLELRTAIITSSFILSSCTGMGPVSPNTEAAGRPTTAKTKVLKVGAKLQSNAPLDPMDVYLVGFHPLKDDPSHQLEAHHFCSQVNEDFAQCVLFDGNTPEANLTGIEYIISSELFDTLPEEEKQYWHPHNGEILSGQLVAPGLPVKAEHELMQSKMNSYGKTWHTWHTDARETDIPSLPLGEPMLAWSFSRYGEAKEEMIKARDNTMGINTQERREDRKALLPYAKPQHGVDVLKNQFSGPTQPIPGVEDINTSEGR